MLRRLFIAVLIAASSLAAFADDPRPAKVVESVSVGYVVVPFTVLDPKNRPITNLNSNEVSLTVDGAEVQRDMFEKSQDAPVSFTILIDGSGSMALWGKMDSARAAIGALLAHRRPGDDFSLWLFAESQARELVPFTEDAKIITDALATVHPYGKTAFFDALATMPERSRLGRNPTRAIVLLSDGIDNASRLKRNDIEQLLEGVSVPIYPLGIRDPREAALESHTREELSDLDMLREVAELTGGKITLGIEPQQIAEAVAELEKDLRSQYLIGFSPTGKGTVKYRKIALKLAGRVRSVRVRAGYLGTEPPVVAAAHVKPKRERKGSR